MDEIAQLATQIVDGLELRQTRADETTRSRLPSLTPLSEIAAAALDLLALPDALASNVRLLEGESEVAKQVWSSSRIGDGQVVHTELRNPEIDRSIANGAMLVIDSVDEQNMKILRLRESLEYRLSARAWINLYMTSGFTSNFGLHYDTFDTIIVQLLGRKHWLVGKTGVPPGSPVSPDSHDTLKSVEMEPGNILMMPARVLHNATGVGDFTLHLTIGFDRSAAVPFLKSEVAELLGSNDPGVDPRDLPLAKARIKERRRGTSLPFAQSCDFIPGTVVRWASRLPPIVEPTTDGAVHVVSGRHELTVGRDDGSAVVAFLADGNEYSIDEIVSHTNSSLDAVKHALRYLASMDLVIFRLTA